jgi:hypothetical protein
MMSLVDAVLLSAVVFKSPILYPAIGAVPESAPVPFSKIIETVLPS